MGLFGFTLAPLFAAEPRLLSLKQAEELAIKNHPRITSAELIALASKQVTRQARSAFFPTITANATAAGASASNTRLAAGGLNNPLVLDRNAEGVNITQLITDFGRTANLTASAKLRSQAEQQNALATRAQILLEVNAAYFDSLQAQSVQEVARQTVSTRQLTFDQVNELAKNNLRSGLDVSFAKVNLEQSKLLLANAQNDLEAAFARLSNLLGEREQESFVLTDEPVAPAAPMDASQLVETALKNRPDLVRLRFSRDAAARFARAEKDLHYPTISAIGSAGVIPVHDPLLRDNYAAAGVNLSVPIFEGFLFSAREKEAQLRSKAATEDLRDEENNVIRDVRLAVLNVNYAAERMTLTAQLLESAKEAFDLAQARYKVGSSSMVELSQAQLSETEAEIGQARAKYEYQVRSAMLNYETGVLQ
ncbi:MAG: Outer rane efflux protein [Pedosphaera sp.]|nr:Outer rane efflux protein [Pedosphaera sp.]